MYLYECKLQTVVIEGLKKGVLEPDDVEEDVVLVEETAAHEE